ncbi:MAG: ATP-binding protein, partial [Oscillibacter sp.]|nr:ATP-binding protein [Oscillibacter sp.]
LVLYYTMFQSLWQDAEQALRQRYLRSLHPFRVREVLERREEWRDAFGRRPADAVSKETVVAVCKAHGQTPEEMLNESGLKPRHGVDPLFCALLLRLADLLDFDDTRAPEVLYRYALDNETSLTEWDKHRASKGFRYPDTPSKDYLPYRAECHNPNVEHAIRDFLNWVDEELGVSHSLQSRCAEKWRDFPFPWKVSRDEICSDGYESGDFRLTMDQEKILELLTGKNLYQDSGVFVRELLQNAVDATLLRERMDRDFSADSDAARIDLWEWADRNGNLWFRIDDRGTGMTKDMLSRYFLKAGNSYYTSDELTRDLKEHKAESYTGISRFGIGFLSCFLSGKSAEVSTLYFDRRKNQREMKTPLWNDTARYGLRLNVTGLSGYYTLQNQASGHFTDPLRQPESANAGILDALEWDGYREEPGTSILICLDPGKLGAVDLKDAVKQWMACPKMPVYYNGERIGQTYREMMDEARRCAGTRTFELNEEQKREWDEAFHEFPEFVGKYPTFSFSVIPLDAPGYPVLEGVSGVLVKVKGHDFNVENFSYRMGTIQYGSKHFTVSIHALRYGSLFSVVTHSFTFCYNEIPHIETLEEGISTVTLCYHGMISGFASSDLFPWSRPQFLITLDRPWQPVMDVGRSEILNLPLEIVLYICAVNCAVNKCTELDLRFQFGRIRNFQWPLADYRKIRKTSLGGWIENTFQERMNSHLNNMEYFQKNVSLSYTHGIVDQNSLNLYFAACFQDDYQISVDYSGETPRFSVSAKPEGGQEHRYDLFPPLLFCQSGNDVSRRYLRAYRFETAGVINASHPYMVWLLDNAEKLHKYFQRQFQQIVESICLSGRNPDMFISTANSVRKQLLSFKERHGIDMSKCPELSKDDFLTVLK